VLVQAAAAGSGTSSVRPVQGVSQMSRCLKSPYCPGNHARFSDGRLGQRRTGVTSGQGERWSRPATGRRVAPVSATSRPPTYIKRGDGGDRQGRVVLAPGGGGRGREVTGGRRSGGPGAGDVDRKAGVAAVDRQEPLRGAAKGRGCWAGGCSASVSPVTAACGNLGNLGNFCAIESGRRRPRAGRSSSFRRRCAPSAQLEPLLLWQKVAQVAHPCAVCGWSVEDGAPRRDGDRKADVARDGDRKGPVLAMGVAEAAERHEGPMTSDERR
jgi:hypothetical protein